MKSLILYNTLGCHLCEHAEAILDAAQCTYEGVDIADDLTLLERYGVRIPVVRDVDGRELGWPFDTAQLMAFLADS
jgi:glutaredoxin